MNHTVKLDISQKCIEPKLHDKNVFFSNRLEIKHFLITNLIL